MARSVAEALQNEKARQYDVLSGLKTFLLGGLGRGGRVDAARFHGDRINEAVQALGVSGRLGRGLEFLGQCAVVASIHDCDRGQRHCNDGEQS